MVATLGCQGFLAAILPEQLVENYYQAGELGVVIDTMAGMGVGSKKKIGTVSLELCLPARGRWGCGDDNGRTL